jgi:thymidylate kinase
MTQQNHEPTLVSPEITLVMGIDGSGKSTFVNNLSQQLGFGVLEPTSSPAAKAFKAANLETFVDASFIDTREAIFLDLNREFDAEIIKTQEQTPRIATTGNSLVTLVSHAVMRHITDTRHTSMEEIVTSWAASDSLKPTSIALIHAPISTIRNRITQRQQDGDSQEKFWGFNAPYFLDHYQEALHEVIAVVEAMGSHALAPCISLNSQFMSPDEMIVAYSKNK